MKGKEKMGDGRGEAERKRKGVEALGKEEGTGRKGRSRLKVHRYGVLTRIRLHPAPQWNPMQQLKSMLSIYTYWHGEMSAKTYTYWLSQEGCLQNRVCNNNSSLKNVFGTETESGRTWSLRLVGVVGGSRVVSFSCLLLGWGAQCQV